MIYDVIANYEEKRHGKKETEEILQELYEVVDEFNFMVKTMDERLDRLVSKMEKATE